MTEEDIALITLISLMINCVVTQVKVIFTIQTDLKRACVHKILNISRYYMDRRYEYCFYDKNI